MLKLKDYKGDRVQIKVNSQKEYKALVPLLNTVFSHWKLSENFFGGKEHIYISMYYDATSVDEYKDHLTIEASLFLEPQIINNYQIY